MAKHPVGRRNGRHKLKALVSSLMSACKSQRRRKLRSISTDRRLLAEELERDDAPSSVITRSMRTRSAASSATKS